MNTGYLGVTFGYEGSTLSGNYSNQKNKLYDLPQYIPTSDTTKFWDNYVEQLLATGVDFVAADLRGFRPGKPVPDEAGDPRFLTQLVDAINRRGAAGQIKIAALDDTAASLADKKNQLVHNTGGASPPFDMAANSPEGGYKYIWQQNEEAYFQAVPDSMRFKLNGRPVIYEWSDNSPDFTDQGNGNSAAMLAYVRQQAQSEFGVDPYLIVDQSWLNNDSTVSSQVMGANGWFSLNNGGETLDTFDGRKYGVAVPGFNVVEGSTNMVIDPDHGNTFVKNLTATVNNQATVTLMEGFTDVLENAAGFRVADGTYDQRHVDYPNQSINILRRFSRNPFPASYRVEAEGADSFSDTTPGNQFNDYRAGDIDVQDSTDTGEGWDVGNIAPSEWLQWQQVPLQGTVDLTARVAAPAAGGQLRFVIDGVAGPTVSVPDTGGAQNWQTLDAGTFTFAPGTYHTVQIQFPAGGFALNYWAGTTRPAPTGHVSGLGGKCADATASNATAGAAIAMESCGTSSSQQWTMANNGTVQALGKCLDVAGGATASGTKVELWGCNSGEGQQWTVTASGQLMNPASGRCLDVTGQNTSDGAPLQIWTCTGGANQKWSVPTQ
ncbi:DUF5010 domain-containing protein (plasmid) [Streptomyces sp. NBC_01497]